MKSPEFERPPLNNLDLFDHRPAPESMDVIFDEYPYEPTLEEIYADYTPEELRDLACKSFYDEGLRGYWRKLPPVQEVDRMEGITPEQRLVLGSARLMVLVLMRDHKSRINLDAQMADRIQNANLYAVAKAGKHDGKHGSLLYDFIQPHFKQIYRSENGNVPAINHGHLIRIKNVMDSQVYRGVRSLYDACKYKYGEFVEIDDIADLMKSANPELIEKYKEINIELIPLSANVPNEQITDEDPSINPENFLNDKSQGVEAALSLLSKKQRIIVERRFGLNGNEPEDARDIARRDGTSVSGVYGYLRGAINILASTQDIRDIIDGIIEPQIARVSPKTDNRKHSSEVNNPEEIQRIISVLVGSEGLMSDLKQHKVTARSIAEGLGMSAPSLSRRLNGYQPMGPELLTEMLLIIDSACRQKLKMTLDEFVQFRDRQEDYKEITEYYSSIDR